MCTHIHDGNLNVRGSPKFQSFCEHARGRGKILCMFYKILITQVGDK